MRTDSKLRSAFPNEFKPPRMHNPNGRIPSVKASQLLRGSTERCFGNYYGDVLRNSNGVIFNKHTDVNLLSGLGRFSLIA